VPLTSQGFGTKSASARAFFVSSSLCTCKAGTLAGASDFLALAKYWLFREVLRLRRKPFVEDFLFGS
jgi:hypothetical protein